MKCSRFDGFGKLKFEVKSPSNLGLYAARVNCLVVFPTHLNPNNFLFYITSNFTPIHVYPRLSNWLINLVYNFYYMA